MPDVWVCTKCGRINMKVNKDGSYEWLYKSCPRHKDKFLKLGHNIALDKEEDCWERLHRLLDLQSSIMDVEFVCQALSKLYNLQHSIPRKWSEEQQQDDLIHQLNKYIRMEQRNVQNLRIYGCMIP